MQLATEGTDESLLTQPDESDNSRPRSAEAEDLIRRAPMAYVWNQVGSLLMFGSSFLFTILVTHGLSTRQYGSLGDALTIFNTVVYLAAFGLEDATTVFIPRTLGNLGRAAASTVIRRVLVTRSLFIIAACAGLIWGIPALASGMSMVHQPWADAVSRALNVPGLDYLAPAVAAYVAGTGMMTLLASIFTALLRTRLTFFVGILQQAGILTGAYVMLHTGHDIIGVIWASAGATWLAALAYFVLLTPFWRRSGPRQPAPSFVPVLQMGWTAWLTNLVSGALLKQVAITLLQAFAVSIAVQGFFNLAFQLSHAAAFLLIAGLGGVGLAAMSAAYSGEDKRSLAFAWRAVSKVQILLAVPLLAFCFIHANAIAVVLYGPKYAPVGPLMQLFLVFNILQRLAGGGSHQAALYVLGKQRLALWTQWAGLVLTITLSFLLIPSPGPLGGAAGALFAVGMGQVSVEFVQLALAWRFLNSKYPLRFGVRVTLALLPPMLLAYLWRPGGLIHLPTKLGPLRIPANLTDLVLSVVVFAIVLVISLAIAKPIEHEDVELLGGVNPRLRPILRPFASGTLSPVAMNISKVPTHRLPPDIPGSRPFPTAMDLGSTNKRPIVTGTMPPKRNHRALRKRRDDR